jgi:beta-barrel assembly-enhancing protease
MRRAIPFVIVSFVGLLGLYFSQRRHDPTPVSANAIVSMAADAQRDLSRAPMRLTRLSDEEEIAVGKELAEGYPISAEKLTPEQQALESYVRQVGTALSLKAHRHLPYSFHLIPDPSVINAFSLPGGPVYVGEGMLDFMSSEDELAAVVGHEIEHIDHYHCAERVQIEARLRNLKLGVVGAIVHIPLQVWEAGYNKDEELEADREGMRLAVLSGYSPYGAVDMFERFRKLHNEFVIRAQSPDDELSQLAIQSLQGYFRSHPLPSERLAQAHTLIAEEGWQDRKQQRPFRVEYEVHSGNYGK